MFKIIIYVHKETCTKILQDNIKKLYGKEETEVNGWYWIFNKQLKEWMRGISFFDVQYVQMWKHLVIFSCYFVFILILSSVYVHHSQNRFLSVLPRACFWGLPVHLSWDDKHRWDEKVRIHTALLLTSQTHQIGLFIWFICQNIFEAANSKRSQTQEKNN